MSENLKFVNVHCVDDLGKYVNNKTEKHLNLSVKYQESGGLNTLLWTATIPVSTEFTESNISSELTSIIRKYCLSYASINMGGSGYNGYFYVGVSSSDDEYFLSHKNIYYVSALCSYSEGWNISGSISSVPYTG